ncbi:hypothetical protein NDI56_21055 [Haloarcula sp. S1CR25-12]|uniref:DUF7389 domain-containing protein n=1 Tax=Haloarcula saliterrae TaxID=2950534 RepID=A0ABU2FI10_9EURY|nr:hypothetical protein [Haloarcula sp. S1CR25-12]MDS0261898.1 hypothetical protein [Haloarcula sp. S1CR25-12]
MTDDNSAADEAQCDTDGTERIERTDIGASIEARLKRGTGTRDEDRITITVKGETADEAASEFEYLLAQYEAEYGDRCRNIQPSKGRHR